MKCSQKNFENWRFWKTAILKNWPFWIFFLHEKKFSLLDPMKISHKLCGRMVGYQFWCFPWFPANSLLCVIYRYTVYFLWNSHFKPKSHYWPKSYFWPKRNGLGQFRLNAISGRKAISADSFYNNFNVSQFLLSNNHCTFETILSSLLAD